MEATTHALINEIVSRRIAESWLYWLLFLIASFLAAFLGAYIRRRAENLATKADFEELKRQLEATTRSTEEIKREISHIEWKSREINALRRGKLEALLEQTSASVDQAALFARRAMVGDQTELDGSHMGKMEAIANLYFPDIHPHVLQLSHDIHDLCQWGLERCMEVVQEKDHGVERYRAALGKSSAGFSGKYEPVARQKSDIEMLAKHEMERLLALPDER